MDTFRRSFKSRTSHKHPPSDSADSENQPILSDHRDSTDNRVILNVDSNPARKPTSEIVPDDPPSRLISSFLDCQKASGIESSLDIDLEMEELKPSSSVPPPFAPAAKDLRISFRDTPPSETPSRRVPHQSSLSSSDEDNEVSPQIPIHGQRSPNPLPTPRLIGASGTIRSPSRNRNHSSLLKPKPKSRLWDPPQPSHDETYTRASNTTPPPPGPRNQNQMQNNNDEEDEDPFASEEIPKKYTRSRFGFFNILQWTSLVIVIAAIACTLAIPRLNRLTLWHLHLWKWELLVFVINCGHLVSGWVIRIIVFFIERNFILRKKVLYFVFGVQRSVQSCLWFGLVLLTWDQIYKTVRRETETSSPILSYVTRILVCLLVATSIWLVKTLLVKVLASSFHVATYFDRIQESLFNQYVIETLSGPPIVEIQMAREEEERVLAEVQKLQNAGARVPPDLRATMMPNKGGKVSRRVTPRSSPIGKNVEFSGSIGMKDMSKQPGVEAITIEHLHKLTQKNVSAWNMKRLMNIVRHSVLSTIDERISDAGGEEEMKIQSEYEAKKAAKKIFNNVARPGAKYIYLVDLMHFMSEEEAVKTMSLFDGTQETKKVSKGALKNWVVSAFQERRALSFTLDDTKTAVKKLHQIVNIIVFVVVFVIWLLILGIATTRVLVVISSQLLVAAFIFGNTVKTTFESIVFLFGEHPYDVGDRCLIDGLQLVVEEMNILTTVFLRQDGLKIMYPNDVLATKPIGNYYRSPDMGEMIDFSIHISTPVEKVALMKERIKAFIDNKKEHWHPNPYILLRDVEDMNRLRVSIWCKHRMNHQSYIGRLSRKEGVVQEMIKTFRELDIEYRMLPLDVNLRNLPPLASSLPPSTWSIFG